MSQRLADKIAIVTGAGGGIGSAICRLFAQEGAAVVAADKDEPRIVATANEVRALGGRAISCCVDIREADQIEAMIIAAASAFGTPNVLINNAGIGAQVHFLDTPMATWKTMLDVNLTGTFLCSQLVAREMAKGAGGRIVNLSSHAGLRGPSGRAAYAAAKGGIIAMTRVMAVDLAQHGIAVNCIAPGPIDMPRVAKAHNEERRAAWAEAIPLARYGKPDEIAFTALFLASDEASYVNGQTLSVDGGFTASGLRVKQL